MASGSARDESAAAAAMRAAAETAAIVLLFAAAGAWPTPDVNEAHFLTKARHWMDPAWVRGDFFLESSDAHGVFYALCGPLAAAVSLESAAWIGRMLGWLAVALGFRHAVVPLVSTSWGRVVAAAAFSLGLRFTTAAGEWVIGGCEAKVFAWALVLAGVGEAAGGRFARAWCACGAAAAIHPVVGGWALVAVAVAWAVERRGRGAADRHRGGGPSSTGWLVAGAVLAACGVAPALGMNAGIDAATRAAADEIYVVERLPHHLLPRSFVAGLAARHLLAVATWWLLHGLLPATAARRRLAALVGAALAVSLAGWLVSLAEPLAPAATHAVLRFYWFRLADVLVPFALACAAAAVLEVDCVCRAAWRVPPGIARAAAVALLGLDLATESAHWPLPGRAVPPRADAKVDAAAWADACDWVRDHVPADACFLTPRGAASFTWRTGRREVVSWKNMPQDARSLVEWRRRIVECFSRDGGVAAMESTTAALGIDRLREVADRYGADHAIVPRAAAEGLPFPRLHENAAYAVIRLAPVTAGGRPGDRP
ncbi:MAG: DUF6798 domain-containing protein [Planctomycetaceae bacterium]